MKKISEKSEIYSCNLIKQSEVYLLLNNFIKYDKIQEFLFNKCISYKIETELVFNFIKQEIDLSLKKNNLKLSDDLKLFLRIQANTGTWYKDSYTPYCEQREIKCSGPIMILNDWGYKCPECKNEISFCGIRLNESPLNKNIGIILPNKITIDMFQKLHNEIYSHQILNELKDIKKISVYEPVVVMGMGLDTPRYLHDIHVKYELPIIITPTNSCKQFFDIYNDTNKENLRFLPIIPIWDIKNHENNIKFKEKMEENFITKGIVKIFDSNAYESSWVSLKDILEIFPDSFNIDTRNFHCINTSMKNKIQTIPKRYFNLVKKYPKRFDYTSEELKEILQMIMEKSGGECEWRYLAFSKYEKETGNWQLKYIQIIKIGDNQYIVTHNDIDELSIIKKDILLSEIDMELLHAH